MKKFIIKTMGCKSNQLEGAIIEENLLKNNFLKTSNIQDADLFILNSCTVTHKSDNEAFGILKRVRKQNPNVKTILTGCIAQIEKQELLDNPNIDLILGNDEKLDLLKYLESENSCKVDDIMKLDSFHRVLIENTGKTRASLKIQDGCDNRCSYCIIPFARGKNRSADVDFLLEQIKCYEDAGFKEIVLTGIHIGQWGLDFEDRKKLQFLLENIEKKTNIKRFRLGSLNPLEIDDEMLNFLANSEKFCPHFHLSLQSMCNATLKSMNRHYKVETSMALIEKISKLFDNPFMGSDIIAGFPGETQEDFAITIKNLEASNLSQIHTFPYSIRQGTVAEKMQGHLDTRIKAERASIIKEISFKKHRRFLERNLGSSQEVLIEKKMNKNGFLKGVTRNYINVIINPENEEVIQNFDKLKNSLQKIEITKISDQNFAELR